MERPKWETSKQIRNISIVPPCLPCSTTAKLLSGTIVTFNQENHIKIILVLVTDQFYFMTQRIIFYSHFLRENVCTGIKYLTNICWCFHKFLFSKGSLISQSSLTYKSVAKCKWMYLKILRQNQLHTVYKMSVHTCTLQEGTNGFMCK